MSKKILITASHYEDLCREAVELFRSNDCELVINHKDFPAFSFEELKEIMGDIDGVIAGLDDWNEEVFKISPKLKVIGRFGVGVDNIDLKAAKKYGIKVANAKGKNANAVAELAVGFMLSAARQIPQLNAELKQGQWRRFVGRELAGMTVGLYGFGDIAKRVAKKLMGFDLNVIACDLYPDRQAAESYHVTLTDRETVLGQSDIVSIHIPDMPETHHAMNAEAFAAMKEGAYFINTARGRLVDTEALCDAVESGHLSGAATDVYEQEPLQMDARILRIPNIVTTPHTGAETYDVYRNVALFTAQEVIDVLEGRDPQNWLNP